MSFQKRPEDQLFSSFFPIDYILISLWAFEFLFSYWLMHVLCLLPSQILKNYMCSPVAFEKWVELSTDFWKALRAFQKWGELSLVAFENTILKVVAHSTTTGCAGWGCCILLGSHDSQAVGQFQKPRFLNGFGLGDDLFHVENINVLAYKSKCKINILFMCRLYTTLGSGLCGPVGWF